MKKYLLLLLLLTTVFITACDGGTQHTHKFVDGECSCGEKDPDYQEHVHQYVNGKCSCGEKEPLQSLNEFLDVEMHKILYKYDNLTKTEYSYIYIGYYPQMEITNELYVSALEKIEEVNERGYIEYNGYEFAKVQVVNNHIYADPNQAGDDVFEYGTSYKPGTTHYFLVQPLAWKVLSYNEFTGEYVIQTENIIDTKSFNDTKEKEIINDDIIYPNEYEHSTIREWLNNGFFDICFTDEEKEMIKTVINKNDAAIRTMDFEFNSEYFYNDTEDRVYLLSYQEVTSSKYGFKNGFICDSTRFATASDYSNAKGLIKHRVPTDEGYTIITSIWMTRTIYEYNTFSISYVGYDGFGYKDFYADAPNVGIRPACTIVLG